MNVPILLLWRRFVPNRCGVNSSCLRIAEPKRNASSSRIAWTGETSWRKSADTVSAPCGLTSDARNAAS